MTNRIAISIIGTEWAGYRLIHKLDPRKSDTTVTSTESMSAYTPLLASAVGGLFNFRLAEEPIRQKSFDLKYIKALVTEVDFEKGVLTCELAFPALRIILFMLKILYIYRYIRKLPFLIPYIGRP